ncbi:uncharacterized protein LOC144291444 isoform X7 [Canis aureus]
MATTRRAVKEDFIEAFKVTSPCQSQLTTTGEKQLLDQIKYDEGLQVTLASGLLQLEREAAPQAAPSSLWNDALLSVTWWHRSVGSR